MESTYVREHGLSHVVFVQLASHTYFFPQSSLFFISQIFPPLLLKPQACQLIWGFPREGNIDSLKKKKPFLGIEKCLVVEHSPSIRTTHTTESWQMYF